MRRVRVWELARDAGVPSAQALAALHRLGVSATAHTSTVDHAVALEALALLRGSANGDGAHTPQTEDMGGVDDGAELVDPWGWKPPPPVTDVALLRRVWQQVGRQRWSVVGVLALDLLGTPLLLLTPIPLKIAVDSALLGRPLPGWLAPVVPAGAAASLTGLVILAGVLQIAVVAGQQAQGLASYVWSTKVGERITLEMRARLFRHVQRLSLTFHDTRGPTHSLYRIEYDAASVRHVVDTVFPFVTQAVMLAATLVVTAFIDVQLAIVALAICPVLFVLSRRHIGRVRHAYRDVRELETDALAVVQEVLGNVRIVKAFGREEAEEQRFVGRSSRGLAAKVRLSMAEGVYGFGIGVTTAVGAALVLGIGVRNVAAGQLSLGNLLVVLGYLSALYGPLREIAQRVGDLQSSMAGAERAFETLDELPEVPERADAQRIQRARGELELRGVRFSYRRRRPVLEDVSVRIPAGTRVGIKGRTGAGKTTMVSLCMRFYDPQAGAVLLDGTDVRDVHLGDLRRQFALVLQEPVLFATSIAENIAYARPGASRRDIVAAAQAAGAHDFVSALPEGYETLVGERGMQLSGGERQRISLARAFLRDAPILVLDEPTSAVDSQTEAQIMGAMERLMEGRTSLMIAHRLSTLEGCDMLLEVRDGDVHVLRRPRAPRRAGGKGRDKAKVPA